MRTTFGKDSSAQSVVEGRTNQQRSSQKRLGFFLASTVRKYVKRTVRSSVRVCET